MLEDTSYRTDKTWSSSKLVDFVCPPFSTEGPAVTCSPVPDYPMHIMLRIEPGQAGTGEPTPENARAIIPRTSIEVRQCGLNLLDLRGRLSSTKGVVVSENEDGTFTFHGTVSEDRVVFIKDCAFSAQLKAGATYYIQSEPTRTEKTGVYIQVTATSRKDGSRVYYTSANGMAAFVAWPEQYDYCVTIQTDRAARTMTFKNWTTGFQIAAAAAPFTRYKPESRSVTVQLGQGIYGGIVDLLTGKIQITEAQIDESIYSRMWYSKNGGQGMARMIFPGKVKVGHTPVCSIFKSYHKSAYMETHEGVYLSESDEQFLDFVVSVSRLTKYGAVAGSTNTYVAAFARMAKELKMQTICTLPEPIERQLPPGQSSALSGFAGINTLWHNAGPLTVQGKTDLQGALKLQQDQIDELREAIVSTGGNI